MQTIRMGSRNDDVRVLQTMLNLAGYVVGIDGIFGSETDSAVRVFQARKGLTVDGIVGVNTWSALTAATQSGDMPTNSGISTYTPSTPKQTKIGITPSGTVPVVVPTPGQSQLPQVIQPIAQAKQKDMGNMWLYIAIGAMVYYYSKQNESNTVIKK